MHDEKNIVNKRVLTAVSNKKDLKTKTVTLLLYQLEKSLPKEAPAISKELRRWYRSMD